MDMVHAPDTLQACPIPEPHHSIFGILLLLQPVNERVLNKVLNRLAGLRQQVTNTRLNIKSRLQPNDNMRDFRRHAVWPVIVHDFVITRGGKWNWILDMEGRSFVWIRGR